MTSNLWLYDQVREVPDAAKKPIVGGRLSGKTDINPMWRIKKLTEMFGACGEGWTVNVVDRTYQPGADGEIAVLTDVELRYMTRGGTWSAPIPGTGGSMYITKEHAGLRTDDDATKKSLTDAISVACKMLGIGASVYWERDTTKYQQDAQTDKEGAGTPPGAGSDNRNAVRVAPTQPPRSAPDAMPAAVPGASRASATATPAASGLATQMQIDKIAQRTSAEEFTALEEKYGASPSWTGDRAAWVIRQLAAKQGGR